MKKKILAAILFAAVTAIAFTSCDWLFGKKKDDHAFPSLIGKWTVVNIADSSKNKDDAIRSAALSMIIKDSVPLMLEFRTDSSFIMQQDTAKYYIDSAVHSIFIQDDSTTEAFSIASQTDSSLQLYSSKDSVMITLMKK